MAKVANGVETLPKISTDCVGCTSATDDRQTDRRQMDGRQHIVEHEFTFAKKQKKKKKKLQVENTMSASAMQGGHKNLKVDLNQQVTVTTGHKCAHITVHYWSTQYSTEQF